MNEHWRYFRALEDDLSNCARYVHFSQENFDTYSMEFARLLLAAASEFDTIAKLLCEEIDPGRTPDSDIVEYRDVITSEYPRFPEVEIHIPRYQLTLAPWEEWKNDQNPEWWGSYNAVKHERNEHFDKATVGAFLSSTAGLLVGLMYWLRETRTDIPSDQAPRFYEPERYDSVGGTPEYERRYWTFALPDAKERRRKRQRK